MGMRQMGRRWKREDLNEEVVYRTAKTHAEKVPWWTDADDAFNERWSDVKKSSELIRVRPPPIRVRVRHDGQDAHQNIPIVRV